MSWGFPNIQRMTIPQLPSVPQQGLAPVCNPPSPPVIMTVMPNKFIFLTHWAIPKSNLLFTPFQSLSDNDGWWPSPFTALTCISLPVCLMANSQTAPFHPFLFPSRFVQTLALLWSPLSSQCHDRHSYPHHRACIPPSTILCVLQTFHHPSFCGSSLPFALVWVHYLLLHWYLSCRSPLCILKG